MTGGSRPAILLGNLAQQHPHAAMLHLLAQELARIAGARFGYLGEAANSVGGYIAAALPAGQDSGLNALAMVAQPRKAYLILHAEPELDCHDPVRTLAALEAADSVIVMSAFRGGATDYADCLLPIAPFSETSGTFINTEGRIQSFNAVVKPQGDARPAWKVLRVLGNLLGIAGFEFETAEAVRDEVLGEESGFVTARVDNGASATVEIDLGAANQGLQRVADVPIHFADALVRRAPSLQRTRDAAAPKAILNSASARNLRLAAGDVVKVRQGGGEVRMEVVIDDAVAHDCVRIAAGHASTAALGAMFGAVTVERA